jgi:hypothetical protein
VTIRTAVAVALAVAILAASLPAIQAARVQHADARIEAAVADLERTARALAAENAVVGTAPARRGISLSLPTESWASSGTAVLDVPPAPAGTDVTWRAGGGSTTNRTFDDVSIVARPAFTLETGGRHRLRLALTRRAGQRVVVVSHPATGSDS